MPDHLPDLGIEHSIRPPRSRSTPRQEGERSASGAGCALKLKCCPILRHGRGRAPSTRAHAIWRARSLNPERARPPGGCAKRSRCCLPISNAFEPCEHAARHLFAPYARIAAFAGTIAGSDCGDRQRAVRVLSRRHGHTPLGVSCCPDVHLSRLVATAPRSVWQPPPPRAGGACQRPAIRGRKRCRLHGGLSPGAPRGFRNGNFKTGDWTTDAITERRWLRSLLQSFAT